MRRSLAVIAVLTLAAVACGDDDGGSSAGADATTDEATADETTADEAACDAWVAVDRAVAVDEDIEAAVAALQDFVAAAPDDVAAAVEPIIPLIREDPETALESDEVLAAENAADEYALATCGGVLDVQAVNFAFEGVPSEIEAGRVTFHLTNQTQTDEFHEALVLRKDGDATGTSHDVLAAALEGPISVDATLSALEPFEVVGLSFVEPDGGDTEDVFVADLEPGDYIVACLLPAGSPDLIDAYFSGEQIDGMRHFDHGMYAEFTVT